ncbi:hypothetical protein THOM_2712 [Trachipleistophora hominis]|uniref:Uncharacterized protein n=1 Tax=Trachipleistophora hominis TaxID=72359 RepID=L7JSE3_TRAHO|nr:hypothetical protein THOM_2712 [Trachipleistophora hominis]
MEDISKRIIQHLLLLPMTPLTDRKKMKRSYNDSQYILNSPLTPHLTRGEQSLAFHPCNSSFNSLS